MVVCLIGLKLLKIKFLCIYLKERKRGRREKGDGTEKEGEERNLSSAGSFSNACGSGAGTTMRTGLHLGPKSLSSHLLPLPQGVHLQQVESVELSKTQVRRDVG